MISIENALKIARKEFPELKVLKCYDAGKNFLFSFSDEDGELVPGIPMVLVSKANGKTDYLTVPPIENLKILEKAKEVRIKGLI